MNKDIKCQKCGRYSKNVYEFWIESTSDNEVTVLCGTCRTILNNGDLYFFKHIANLEAKLAESEKNLEDAEEHELLIDQFEEETEKLRKQIKQESDARKRFVEEVKNLKQQLAEKDKYIEDLLGQTGVDENTILELKDKLAEKENELEKYKNCKMIVVGGRSQGRKHFMQIKIKELQNQTAIAELEKVKDLLERKIDDGCVYVSVDSLYDLIRLKIKSLKGDK